MAGFNKTLNVFIFILSIATLWFSILLWKQRDELRDRGDTIAKTVYEASKRLQGLGCIIDEKERKGDDTDPDKMYLNSNLQMYMDGDREAVCYFHEGRYTEDSAKPHGLVIAEPEAIEIYRADVENKKAGSSNDWKPKTKIPDGGALSWRKFTEKRAADIEENKEDKEYKFSVWSDHEVSGTTRWSKNLNMFLEQVDIIMLQRDYFVKHVNKMAIELGTTLKGFNAADYETKDMAMVGALGGIGNQTYAPRALSLEMLAKANSARTEALIKAIGEWYLKVEDEDIEMETDPFRTLLTVTGDDGIEVGTFQYAEQLSEITSNLSDLRTRMNATAKSFAEGVSKVVSIEYNMQTTAADLERKDRYNEQLSKFVDDMGNINDKLDELTKTRDDLEATQAELEDMTRQRDDLTRRLTNEEQEHAETKRLKKLLQNKLNRLQERLDPAIFLELDTTIEGTVTSYNEQFGFVVFNLGVTKGGKYQVAPYIDMLIMRGDRYIGRIRITEVKIDKSIAEVHQVVAGEKIKVGDKIIFKESSGVALEAQYTLEKDKADAMTKADEDAAREEELEREEQDGGE